MKTVQELSDFVGGVIQGNPLEQINKIGSLEQAEAGTLAYAEDKYVEQVVSSRASCILVSSGEFPGRTVVIVDKPRIAFARIAQWMFPSERPFKGVHQTAIVDAKAKLGKNVSVGAWVCIETGARIGSGTILFPGCYIGSNCRIGSNCVIYPNSVLYSNVEIGDRVIVHAGVVLGADGFGFVSDGNKQIKLPQMGRVVIDSDVEIGSNSCVDRGTFDETMISEGVKIDNLCQIAHNVYIGCHTLIASQSGVAGSSRIGNHVTIGGQVGIGDHCRIDDSALLGAQCGVPSRKRLPTKEIYWGTPARLLKDVRIQQAYVGRLPKIVEELKKLREELDQLRQKTDSKNSV